LEYIPFSDYVAFSQQRGVALERFHELFRLDEWRKIDSTEQQSKELKFDDLIAELSEVFVGRVDDISEVKKILKAQPNGVLWISGKPGVGKSALMARLVRDYQNAPQHYLTIPYFFRIGHSGCSTEQFLKAALLHLHVALGLPFKPAVTIDEQRQQFVDLVRNAGECIGKKILFLVDGLDEIYRLEPAFISLPFIATAPRVLWLCAGRNELPEMETSLRQSGAEWVFSTGLPAMDEQDIRSMMTAYLERLKYQLFARDEITEGHAGNRFLEVLTHKSDGLPLYVRMVIDDLRRGKWTLQDEDKLPDGLRAYFEQILERLRVSDTGTVLTPLFCLLAWAAEPITESTLRLLLREHYLSKSERWEELFRKALDHGHLMLRPALTPEAKTGWTFYHDTFRQHLRESVLIRDNREWALEIEFFANVGYGRSQAAIL